MRSLIVTAGLAAALAAASIAAGAAPAAAASGVVVDWSSGHRWGPAPGPYFYPAPPADWYGEWAPRPAWYRIWGPRYEPWRAGYVGARVATVRQELSSDSDRLAHDRAVGRVDRAEYVSLLGEDRAIRGEADREALPYGGLSYAEFIRLQGEVHALSGEIARADGVGLG